MWWLLLSPTCPCWSLSTFSTLLPASTWATFMPPPWLPSPAHLTQLAKVAYTYWHKQQTKQGGHCIISTLDYDETGSQNKSYICFQHWKIRAISKTGASQITSFFSSNSISYHLYAISTFLQSSRNFLGTSQAHPTLPEIIQ